MGHLETILSYAREEEICLNTEPSSALMFPNIWISSTTSFCITSGFCLGCCLTNGKWTGSKNFPVEMGTCWSGLHFSGELQQDRQLWTLALSLHASLHSGIEPRFLLLSSLQIICCLYKNILFLHESRPVDLEGKVKLKLVLFHNWFVWQPVRNLFPTTYPSSWRNFF